MQLKKFLLTVYLYNITITNMALTDTEIFEEFTNRVSRLYVDKKITEREANELFFYGLYNNKHNGVPKLNSLEEVDEYTRKLYEPKRTVKQ